MVNAINRRFGKNISDGIIDGFSSGATFAEWFFDDDTGFSRHQPMMGEPFANAAEYIRTDGQIKNPNNILAIRQFFVDGQPTIIFGSLCGIIGEARQKALNNFRTGVGGFGVTVNCCGGKVAELLVGQLLARCADNAGARRQLPLFIPVKQGGQKLAL